MLPAFHPGDRLLVIPLARVREGDVVAVDDPGRVGRLLVKRVHRLAGDRLDVRGDNPAASTDSRQFGLLPVGAVRGRAVYRYHPPDRSGWLAE
jgi:nickel-type superoxide dismutase maturation protease